MDETVTATTLARFLGVSTRSIHELAEKGLAVRGADGRYRFEETIRRVVEDMRRTIAGRGGAAVAASGAVERARLAKERADGLALENAHRRGALLDAGAVEREWTGILAGVRSRMLAVASRTAQRLPHLLPHDVGAIDGEIREALAEIGNGGMAGSADPG